jgi:hypothetical protein
VDHCLSSNETFHAFDFPPCSPGMEQTTVCIDPSCSEMKCLYGNKPICCTMGAIIIVDHACVSCTTRVVAFESMLVSSDKPVVSMIHKNL